MPCRAATDTHVAAPYAWPASAQKHMVNEYRREYFEQPSGSTDTPDIDNIDAQRLIDTRYVTLDTVQDDGRAALRSTGFQPV